MSDKCHVEDDLNKISKVIEEREEKAFKYEQLIKIIKEKIEELNYDEQQANNGKLNLTHDEWIELYAIKEFCRSLVGEDIS